MPGRMPVMPRELEVPEQFTLPYAKTNFDAPRGREPLLNLGWADEEIQRNVGRRTMLATSKERQIERETGFSLEVSEVEQKRRDRLRKKQLEEEGKEANSQSMTAKEKEEYMYQLIVNKRAKAAENKEECVKEDDNPFAEGT